MWKNSCFSCKTHKWNAMRKKFSVIEELAGGVLKKKEKKFRNERKEMMSRVRKRACKI